jgi:SAM-dependent methyltransferase
MSHVFQEYSKYYDLLYKDKNYDQESQFIIDIIKRYAPDSKTILNLGCGTGEHDRRIALQGYNLTGVDLSSDMVAIAKLKNNIPNCVFKSGDARYFRGDNAFDVVVALFHVLSYQTSNEDFSAFVDTVYANLKPGGIAIFDYWYGPAVLNQKAENRIKKMKNDSLEITRFASTSMDYNKNVATVSYDIMLRNKKTDSVSNLNEDHPMRYYFIPEIELMLGHKKLNLLGHFSWMSLEKIPHIDTWAAYTVIRK